MNSLLAQPTCGWKKYVAMKKLAVDKFSQPALIVLRVEDLQKYQYSRF